MIENNTLFDKLLLLSMLIILFIHGTTVNGWYGLPSQHVSIGVHQELGICNKESIRYDLMFNKQYEVICQEHLPDYDWVLKGTGRTINDCKRYSLLTLSYTALTLFNDTLIVFYGAPCHVL